MCEWNGVYIELWRSLADTALEAHLALGVEEHNFGLYHMLEACLALWDV